ncbi:MAG TPA: bifunctional nuclease domain-containing protein [Streptosporangiaceae bacterium]|jgi:RNA polymerase sigma-70 factor (ECF subfamily)
MSSAEVSDGDLVRLARDGDPVAFRLLAERHLPMARARARQLCANPSDVDDVVQESLLRAYTGLDRLRDPDRFAGWLAGIVLNTCRGLRRQVPVVLLGDWPEPIHPASDGGVPSAEDLDRAGAVQAAVAVLPEGQRRAVALHYYAGLPAGQAAAVPGAARASLHKARLRLRAYLTEHRPDLIPSTRRTAMTTVRIAQVECALPAGPIPLRSPTHVVVLRDEPGRRELPVWLLGQDGVRLETLFRSAGNGKTGTLAAQTPEELTARLLRAAGAGVAAVEVEEPAPGVTAARIRLTGSADTRPVAARLPDGLALAIVTAAPVRVADPVMDRLAVPVGQGRPPATVPEQTARDLSPGPRPRYEPRNLTFADGLDGWLLGGSFTEHPSEVHWHDYASSADGQIAVLAATVPQPAGFAFLGQEIFADDFRGAVVVLRTQMRASGVTGQAGLFLRTRQLRDARGPLTADAALADPGTQAAFMPGGDGWAEMELTARIAGDANTAIFGMFLAGGGRIELQNPELARVRGPGLRR